MRLRTYKEADAEKIVSWVKDERTLYYWSANLLNQFPLDSQTLVRFYREHPEYMVFVACDEDDEVVGQVNMRELGNEGE